MRVWLAAVTSAILLLPPFASIEAIATLPDTPIRSAEDRKAQANQLLTQGVSQLQNSDYQQALQSLQTALQIHQEIGDRPGELMAVNSLGATYFQLGQYHQSIEMSQRALALMQTATEPNLEMQMVTLINLGLSYQYLGEYARSIQSLQQARTLGETSNQPLLAATSLVSLGDAYRTIGQYERAVHLFEQALARLRSSLPDARLEQAWRQAEAGALVNLGIAYTAQQQFPQAIASLQQGLNLAQAIGDRQIQARALLNLGGAYLTGGQPQRAQSVFQQSLDLAQEIGDRQGEAIAWGNLGYAHRELGNFTQAIAAYQQSIAIKRELGDRQGEAISLSNYAYALLMANRPQQAESLLHESIEILESLRTGLEDNRDRIALIDTQAYAYENLQNALIMQNQPEAALEVAERGRAQAFTELLARHLTAERSPEDERQVRSNPLSIADIQRIARQQNATLIEYSIIDDQKLFIWVVKPSGEIAFRQTNFTHFQLDARPALAATNHQPNATAIDALVSATRGAVIADREAGDRIDLTQSWRLRQLHQLLIEPIQDLLPTEPNDRLILIPQGSLFLVPFPALQTASGEYLIERHTLSIAPSIQVLDLAEQRRASQSSLGDRALIVGNPTMPTLPTLSGEPAQALAALPGAEQEAKAIAEFFDTEALVGTQATETAVVEQMATARIVHLATHGLLQYGQPDEYGILDTPGAIALAPSATDDGLLTASEILNLNLNAQLVVLSACDTGRGRITGDGVVGLSRSLLAAGVPSLIVSLWAAADIPTSDLMTQFYRQLEQNPDKAQALRQAMLETMKQHSHPKDWAAFTLIGTPR
ncbi:CHAT domain-containing protein [Microcoleus sp. FACHB-1515]|uniref:CHAT domain-containing tetratricopeptide repeat protein n=1 Tax=Cyanophyceae TaxID=3028117 RepID=UPI001686BFE5|nr:CHAT domain-containing protein [Microcoleus sp. FACHB-1515]MBD2092545.1 CHAT domain-containing protein [Microcoleus sp. FACHB-1515]